MKRILKILLIALFAMTIKSSLPNAADLNKVVVSNFVGTVSVQMEEYVARVIKHAERENAVLVVFKLDTPGGLVEATRGITQMILNSNVPIVMWVPPGGRAASAGCFLMQAAHVAAMSTGTNIGAASPVIASGSDVPDGDMKKKVFNDLKAYMRSLTHLRGRNEEIAQRMIDESISLTAYEALEGYSIDIIADDIDTLLIAINGRRVEVNGKQTVINVSPNTYIENVEMSFPEKFIQFLSSPDIAYLLLAGGLLAIFYEIITPGGFILGATGVAMLLLGGIGLKMLPFNWAGVALTVAGVIMIGLEMIVGASGLLGLLGVALMIAGGMFLFKAPGNELLNASMTAITSIAIILGILFIILAVLITKGLRSRVTTGREGLIGVNVELTEDLNPSGIVKCQGEVWKARAVDGSLRRGDSAVVTSIEGMVLVVKEK